MVMLNKDDYWMQKALELANFAKLNNEVPVGAVLVIDDEILSVGWNQPIATSDPTAHAEIIALREGARRTANYRLINATLYVTLEPCVMCAGALIHSRIKRLVYGAKDSKAGAVESVFEILKNTKLNHKILVEGGLLAEACGKILSEFFQEKRRCFNHESAEEVS